MTEKERYECSGYITKALDHLRMARIEAPTNKAGQEIMRLLEKAQLLTSHALKIALEDEQKETQ